MLAARPAKITKKFLKKKLFEIKRNFVLAHSLFISTPEAKSVNMLYAKIQPHQDRISLAGQEQFLAREAGWPKQVDRFPVVLQ